MAWLPGRTLGSALDKTARLPNGMTIEDYENSQRTVTLTGVWLEFEGEGGKAVGFDLGLIAAYYTGGNGGTAIKFVFSDGSGVWVKDSPEKVKEKIEQARQILEGAKGDPQ